MVERSKKRWGALVLLLAGGLAAFFFLKGKTKKGVFEIQSITNVPAKSGMFAIVTLTVTVINTGNPSGGKLRFFRKSTGNEINADKPEEIPFLNNGESAEVKKVLVQNDNPETIIVRAEDEDGNTTDTSEVTLSSA